MVHRRAAQLAAEKVRPPLITMVRDDSPCRGRVAAGDLLVEINGKPPLDILDYLEASEERRVRLRLLREGKEVVCKVRKRQGVPLGLVFEEAVFDGVRTCRNDCLFCFVDRMPGGLRHALYVKDDDYRLSFYYGNFITLNNLSAVDVERIRRLRLSPLYVSLHSTDAAVRTRLMGGDARRGLEVLKILLDEGLQIHLQVVVCPGINDEASLACTLRDVLTHFPAASMGVVPVGLASPDPLRKETLSPHDSESALGVLELVGEYQAHALGSYGRRIFFAADEFYLLAGRAFPPAEEYEDYPQLENGVGMSRRFVDEVREGAGDCTGQRTPVRGIITGVAGEKVIATALREAGMRGVEVVVVENHLMGTAVTVTALLGGADIIAALRKRRPASPELLIPASMLREGLFIDEKTPADVARETGYRLLPVEVDGARFVTALYGREESE